MIGFCIYHALCNYYLKINKTKNVIPTIQSISRYGSCILYVVLVILFLDIGICSILIAVVAVFEILAMCILPISKTSAAYQLIQIDWMNKGWNLDENCVMKMV